MNDPEKGQYGHKRDMLVVDTDHERLVMDTLGEGAAKVVDSDATLRLTLIGLTDATKVPDRLQERVDRLPEPLRPAPEPDEDSSELDEVLADLRAVFEQDYDGWTPRMGKNRFMTGIQFVTYPNAEVPGFTSIAMPTDASVNDIAMEINEAGHRSAGEGVRVGLLDTRMYQHRLLAGRYVAPPDSLLPTITKPVPYIHGHAAFLVSRVLAEAPSAQLDVRAVARPYDAGQSDWDTTVGDTTVGDTTVGDTTVGDTTVWDTTIWAAAKQMVQYRSSGVRLLNCSWVCYTRDGKPPLVLERAVGLLAPEVLVIAAAGNHGQYMAAEGSLDPEAEDKAFREANDLPARNAPAYPAALPDVVAVGAFGDDARHPADFNPKGAGPRSLAPWINVLAPGVDVLGAYFGDTGPQDVLIRKLSGSGEGWAAYLNAEPEYEVGSYNGAARWSGTSFAAATVSGAIAARLPSCDSPREALEQVLKEDGRITGP